MFSRALEPSHTPLPKTHAASPGQSIVLSASSGYDETIRWTRNASASAIGDLCSLVLQSHNPLGLTYLSHRVPVLGLFAKRPASGPIKLTHRLQVG